MGTTLERPPLLRKHRRDGRYVPATGPLWRGQPRFDDVGQGSIGDCGLIAVFAACARARPQLITSLFEPKKRGGYRVNLPGLIRSRRPDDNVDEWVPASSTGHPLYGRSPNGVQWPSVLERAFAQQVGYENASEQLASVTKTGRIRWRPKGERIGYNALYGFRADIAMSLITGRPTFCYSTQYNPKNSSPNPLYLISKEDVLGAASAAARLGQPIVAATRIGAFSSAEVRRARAKALQAYWRTPRTLMACLRNDSKIIAQGGAYEKRARAFGLASGHEYAVVGADIRRNTLEVYNPHGKTDTAGGGLFTLSFEEFSAHFSTITTPISYRQACREYRLACGYRL